MSKHDIDPLEFGLSQEEYERKQREYYDNLKESIRLDRQRLKRFIQATFDDAQASQEALRMMSWTHAREMKADLGYLNQCKHTLRTLEEPLHAASSRQDAYHLMHFIHAVLLSLYKPGVQSFQELPVTLEPWILEELNEPLRIERQSILFATLVELIPNVKEKLMTRVTNQNIFEKLLEIERLLKEKE